MALSILAIGFKFAFYLSSLQACGIALLLVIFSAELATQADTCVRHMRRWAILCALSAIGFVAATSATLWEFGGIQLVMDYLKSTGYAAALAVQLIACGSLLFGGIIAAIGAIALLGSFALVGHIGTSFLANALVLHLIFGSIWFAVLSPLRRMASTPHTTGDAARLGRSFGRLAQAFVPLSLMLGGLLAWSVSSSLSELLQTPYGWTLIGKIACSAGLLWAGAVNKLRLVPALETGDANAAAHLAFTVRAEWWLFVVILVLTAALTTNLTPP